jgi:hypothetical protein
MFIHVQFLFNQICSFQEKKSFTFSLKNKMLTITQWTCMSSLFSINNIITGMFSLPWVKGEIGENVLQRPPATTYVQEARNFPGNYSFNRKHITYTFLKLFKFWNEPIVDFKENVGLFYLDVIKPSLEIFYIFTKK